MSPAYRIIQATDEKDARTAAVTIAAAFTDLASCEWLVPDPAERPSVLEDVFFITAKHALDHGVIYLLIADDDEARRTRVGTRDVLGAAVWFDRTRPVPFPRNYEKRLWDAAGPRNFDRFQTLDLFFEKFHPYGPHHYLAFLAVAPDAQGAGLGAALLRHHHTYLDEHRMPAYLEASSEESFFLYSRHGYQARDTFSPSRDSGVQFWPMWRQPYQEGPA
jgi:ribosomal protein S18 acetylase RimI-like enzyme